jgi:glycosyltransferase involved in cell wall biosynthesis
MRIALVMNLAPRKLGSLEDWAVAFCREARWQGHLIDAYGRAPVHPEFARKLKAFGVAWRPAELLERGMESVRLLSQYDVIHLDLFAPRSKVALAAYAALPAKVLFVTHSQHLPSTESLLHRLAARALDRVTLSRVHSLGGVSEFVREEQRRRFGLSRERSRTLYNGVDTQRFRPPAQERNGLRLFTAAWFQPHKGVHHVIRAFAKLRTPGATLSIAGDGPESAALEKLAIELGVANRVRFLGMRDDLEKILPEMDVFVHSSHVEAFGLTIAEAMACGRAVVASRVGGVSELVEDGQSGLLIEPGDEVALAAAIDRLLEDDALRRRLGENARTRIVQRFGLRKSAVEHLLWCEAAFSERSLIHRTVRPEPAHDDVLRIPQPRSKVPMPMPLPVRDRARPEIIEPPRVHPDAT